MYSEPMPAHIDLYTFQALCQPDYNLQLTQITTFSSARLPPTADSDHCLQLTQITTFSWIRSQHSARPDHRLQLTQIATFSTFLAPLSATRTRHDSTAQWRSKVHLVSSTSRLYQDTLHSETIRHLIDRSGSANINNHAPFYIYIFYRTWCTE